MGKDYDDYDCDNDDCDNSVCVRCADQKKEIAENARRMAETRAAILEVIGAKAGSDVALQVELAVDWAFMRRYAGPAGGFRQENVESATKIRKWIEAGIGPENEYLVSGLIFEPASALFGDEHWAAMAEQESLAEALNELRRRCDRIIQSQPGKHRNAGYQQEKAAEYSRELMEKCGLPLIHTNPYGPYRAVASLLYELMTGDADKDLERACEVVARRSAIGTDV